MKVSWIKRATFGIWPYVAATVASLGALALVAGLGYRVRPYFPNSLLHSSDIFIVLATVIVAVANVSLVRVTREYTAVANESIKLAKVQHEEALTIRFEHGLQFDPPDVTMPHNHPARVWVANLGARSFVVREIVVRRHDQEEIRGPFEKKWNGDQPIQWNEVIGAGEKKMFNVPGGFWEGYLNPGRDVEVSVTVEDGAQAPVVKLHGFYVVGGEGQPMKITQGFGALWHAECPNCNGYGRFFKPEGSDSFAEVAEKWTKPIQEDFARTCPDHKSERALGF